MTNHRQKDLDQWLGWSRGVPVLEVVDRGEAKAVEVAAHARTRLELEDIHMLADEAVACGGNREVEEVVEECCYCSKARVLDRMQ